jgi:anti-sigma B factor antagonist
MAIRIRGAGGVEILDVDGNIDINSSELIEAIGSLVSSGKLNILVNFENVDMVDYSGLSILAIAYKNVTNHNGKMKLSRVPLPVIELLKVVKLDSVFEIYSDEMSAIESFFGDAASAHQMRRKFQRLDLHIRITYKPAGDGEGAQLFDGTGLNLSAAGVYIHSERILPLNSVIKIYLDMPGLPHKLEAEGRVVYVADKEIQPHVYPGMGVAFTHLDTKKERTIVDFIDKNSTHRADET